MRERKMDKRIQCPVCGKEGVLQWKETVTKAKGKTYRYKKLYVYHWNPKKPRWCYLNKEQLEALETPKRSLTQNKHSLTQNLTQNTTSSEKPKSSSFYRDNSAHSCGRSLVWLGHQPATLTTRVQIPAAAPPLLFATHNDARFFVLAAEAVYLQRHACGIKQPKKGSLTASVRGTLS